MREQAAARVRLHLLDERVVDDAGEDGLERLSLHRRRASVLGRATRLQRVGLRRHRQNRSQNSRCERRDSHDGRS